MCVLSPGRHCCCLTRIWVRNLKYSSPSSSSGNKPSHAGVNESLPSNCQHSPKLSRGKSDKSDFRIAWQIHLSLLVATVACYASAIRGDFVHDDIEAIKQSPDVTGHTSIYQLFLNDFWGRPMKDPLSHKSYRPLTVLSFRLNMILASKFDESVKVSWIFRSINVLLHSLVVQLIVITLVYGVNCPYNTAFIISLHFATHPIHTEAVSSSVGRADILCAIFCLISLFTFMRAIKENKSLGRLILILVASLSSSLALLSKETGITILPICILFYLYHVFQLSIKRNPLIWLGIRSAIERFVNPFGKQDKKKTLHKINFECSLHSFGPLIIPVITLISLLWFRLSMLYGSLPFFSEQDNPAAFSDSHLTRLLTYLYLCAFNGRLFVLPSTLAYDWQMGSVPLVQSLLDIRILELLLAMSIVFALIWVQFRSIITIDHDSKNKVEMDQKEQEKSQQQQQQQAIIYRLQFLGLCLLIIPFIPASNLFFTVGFVVAERILYIPSLGFSIIFAIGYEKILDHMFRSRGEQAYRYTKFAFYCLIFAFSIKTVCHNHVWLTRETLFRSGVKTIPNNAKMHYNYANLLRDFGNTELAMHHYRTALSLWPNHESSWNNLATLLTDPQEAEQHLKQALRINPYHSKAHFNLACIYSKKGLPRKAEALFKRSIQLDSTFAEPLSSLASLYSELGNYKDANELHLRALHIQPNNPDMINNYGAFLHKMGDIDAAIFQYEKALDIKPAHKIATANLMQIRKSLNYTKPMVFQRSKFMGIGI
ncbi:protein O-mannosyl-transferase TMTC1-like [Brevipalpus obovatus]|uniref:protein O-mannosyl-transferase TMTC1-like n=1 Tax=Brevipalpus obovatus TaxID=246614 RepID=UPI003D9DD657